VCSGKNKHLFYNVIPEKKLAKLNENFRWYNKYEIECVRFECVEDVQLVEDGEKLGENHLLKMMHSLHIMFIDAVMTLRCC